MSRSAVSPSRSRRTTRTTRRAAAGRGATASDGKLNSYLTAPITPDAVKRIWQLIRQKQITVVDLKFNDLPGLWQHFSIPIEELSQNANEGIWDEGIGFDGSSIRGFQKIHESDMNLYPDPSTAVLDPVCKVPTLNLVCDIYDPLTKQPYSRDPRYIAKKAERYLKKTGIADISYWGPEPEFFIFDDIRFDCNEQSSYYFIDSVEGQWNSGRDEKPNLGYKTRHKEGYFPVPPHDIFQDIRSEIMSRARAVGVPVEKHHHEVATAGQAEIDMRYAPLTKMADHLMMLKYVSKNVAKEHNKVLTYMPKPLFNDNGSGMHVHSSLAKAGTNLFFDKDGYALTSQMCRWYIGGLLKHAAAVLAFAAPTTNSYKRLVPGFEAPVNLAYSARNRSAICRIPVYTPNPKSKRVEFRAPDPSCNPYLTFSALLLAGLDGIQHRIDPGKALDKNIYELSPAELAKIKTVPGSLEAALDALEKDHEFLLKGDVFTKDVIDVWLEYKRGEIDKMRLYPHPYEFFLYFDV